MAERSTTHRVTTHLVGPACRNVTRGFLALGLKGNLRAESVADENQKWGSRSPPRALENRVELAVSLHTVPSHRESLHGSAVACASVGNGPD